MDRERIRVDLDGFTGLLLMSAVALLSFPLYEIAKALREIAEALQALAAK